MCLLTGMGFFFLNNELLKSLYWNLNPDFININNGKWNLLFEFETSEKCHNVKVFGKPGKQKYSGEFVIVRKGILPFGLELVSKKYVENNVLLESSTFGHPKNYVWKFCCRTGIYNLYSDSTSNNYSPSIMLAIQYMPKADLLSLVDIRTVNCDNIPTVKDASCWAKRDSIKEYFYVKSFKIYPQIKNVFELKKEFW